MKSAPRYLLLGAAIAFAHSAYAIDLNSDCKGSVDNFSDMLSCGSVEGSLRLYNYSTHNAYFAGSNQDTTTIGGYATYKTAEFNGFQAAVGVNGQNRLAEGSARIDELAGNRLGLGEAWLSYTKGLFSIKAGNQRLDIPFMGDYADWRVMEYLYQGVDMKYGDDDDFVRLTRVFRTKTYGASGFNKVSRLNDDAFIFDEDGNPYGHNQTNGALILGGGKKFTLGGNDLRTQLWMQKYYDIETMYYGEASYAINNAFWKPEIGIQGIRSTETGDADLGQINARTVGAQIKLHPTSTLTWQIGYDKLFMDDEAYLNGNIAAPYSHNTSSGPYFAQPFFTSTQDLGTGNAFQTQLSAPVGDKLFLATRYSYMQARNQAGDDRDYSEYLVFGIYNFGGALEGFSIGNFFGVQTSPYYGRNFVQNRLQLSYNF